MARGKEIEVFGLSFMDLISCGLGGMLVLLLIFSTLVNPEGVAIQSEAKAKGKTVAELERELILNTHFVLKITLDDSQIDVIPLNYNDMFSSIGKKDETHIFMFNSTNRIVDIVSFRVTGDFINGEAQLLGQTAVKIPPGTEIIEVIKDRTNYKIRFRNA